MDQGLTEIIVIADRSGSMGAVKDETIQGFNAFLEEQQKSRIGRCLLTYCQFSHDYEIVHEALPIEEMRPLDHTTFRPLGSTALFDAVCHTIDLVGARLARTPEEQRPGSVVVVIMTDGDENSSTKFTMQGVKDRITHQADVYKWAFIFLGQNIDAFRVGKQIGLSKAHDRMFIGDIVDQRRAYRVASAAVVGARSKSAGGMSVNFSAQEKSAYTIGLEEDSQALEALKQSYEKGLTGS